MINEPDGIQNIEIKDNRYAYDRLTGLININYFYFLANDIIENAFKNEETNTRFTFVYFNVDNFKAFNSEHGYENGDIFLCKLAALIKEAFPGELVGRTSNDHFIVLTKRIDIEEKVLQINSKAHFIQQGSKTEVHAGIYEYENGVSMNQSHDRSKTACDVIKGNYSRIFCYYDDELREKMAREKDIIDNIDSAVENEYLQVYYQPIMRVLSNKICSMESLVRWNDPKLGFLLPGEFIPVLEKRHLVHKIDQFVLDKVCRDQNSAKIMGETIVPVSINLSRLDFQLMDVYEMITRTIKKYDISPKLINLEITESALDENEEKLIETIARLREQGFEIWLDDFGSEYSTLNTLQNFKFDLLKIDMKFFSKFDLNKNASTIISAITDMAKRLHMRVLAEGIETEEQYEFLKRIGCDNAQGYYISRPCPLDALMGMDIEKEDEMERKYFCTIGDVNFLSLNPLEDYNDSKKIYNVAPTAIVQYENESFKYLYINDVFEKCLKDIGVNSKKESEYIINDDVTRLKTRLQGISKKSHETKNIETTDLIYNGFHINLQAREIAYNNGIQALFVTMYNLSEMENVKKIDKLEMSLNFLYSIYDRVDILDPTEDKIENIYLNSQYYETNFTGRNLLEGIDLYAQTDIAEEDIERFKNFYDLSTLDERLAKRNKDYVTQVFKTLTHKEGVNVQLYILIRIFDGESTKYISCVRDIIGNHDFVTNNIIESTRSHKHDWYQIVLNEFNAAIFEWDIKNGKSYASSRAYNYALCKNGLNDVLNNKASLDAVYNEDITVLKKFFMESKSGKSRVEATLRLKVDDGSYRWSNIVGLFKYDDKGDREYIIGMIKDVENEHKHYTQAKFFNQIPMALGVFEVNNGVTRQLFMNDAYYKLVEDKREFRQRYNNTSFISRIHEEDRKKVIDAMKRVIAGDDSCSEICKVKTGSGDYKWIRFSSKVAERKENYLLVYSTYVDIEENSFIGFNEKESTNDETIKALKREKRLSQCLKLMTNDENVEQNLENVMKIVQKQYMAERVYIFEFDWSKDEMSNTYEYVADGVTKEKDNLQNLPTSTVSQWMKQFEKAQSVFLDDLEAIKDIPERKDEYEVLKPQGIKQLMVIPIIKNEHLFGYVGVDNPATSTMDKAFLTSVANILSQEFFAREQQNKLIEMSLKDPLTKINNRHSFNTCIDLIDGTYQKGTGVVFADVNGLKYMNDNFGHRQGDKLVCLAAKILVKYFSDKKTYRISGDEFAVIDEGINKEDFLKKAEEMKQAVLEEYGSVFSIGIEWECGKVNINEMIARAEQMMYIDKQLYYNDNPLQRRKELEGIINIKEK